MTTTGFYSVDSLRGVCALVVDDDPDGGRAVAEILRYCGALVSMAGAMHDALRVMRRLKPDVLVVAVSVTADAAVGLIGHIRGLKPEEGAMVPAIALTRELADGDEVLRRRGFEATLAWPFEAWALCRAVASVTSARR